MEPSPGTVDLASLAPPLRALVEGQQATVEALRAEVAALTDRNRRLEEHGPEVVVEDLDLPQRRHDVLGEHDAVVGYGRRSATHRDVLALVALGELGHRWVGLRCDRNGLFSGLDAGNDASGFLAGLIG